MTKKPPHSIPQQIQEVLRYNVKLFQFQAEFDYVAAQTKINEDFMSTQHQVFIWLTWEFQKKKY